MGEKVNQNSMLYWYPKIKDLSIPQPRTEIVELKASYWELLAILDGEGYEAIENQIEELEEACAKIGIPAFMRTAYTSGKHDWTDTCYVIDASKIRRHIGMLVEDSALKEIPIDAFVFREFIEMDSKFTAFSGAMPVNPERRYFIKDGKIQCRHQYWIKEAIAEDDEAWAAHGMSKLPKNWIFLLYEMNIETDEEVALLSGYAEQVAEIMEGYWSVDFCKAKDGRWILIDMATGERSLHDERCEYYVSD